ncbi:MAG: Aldose 1-epimerase [Bacteroidota bacterium]|jgi:aldose 1-epimerase
MKPVEIKEFGQLPDGQMVYSYLLKNKHGMMVELISYGAVLRSCVLPGNQGLDVVLGFDRLEDYLASMNMENPPYFGSIVGPFAGRIQQGVFSLNNKVYQLSQNHGSHHLHGGIDSFSRALWLAEPQTAEQSITLKHVSTVGTDGYPGEITSTLTYSLTDDNELKMNYKAESTEDTIINVTQHHYWNLGGHDQSVENQSIQLNATHFLDKNTDNIPTGNFEQFCEKPFNDLTTGLRSGLDHTFVISDQSEIQASLSHPTTGWKMLVKSNQPAAHLFIGCGLPENLNGKQGFSYHATSGVCFEMQNFPDAPNHEHFPSCVLRKDEVYENNTIFHFVNNDHV